MKLLKTVKNEIVSNKKSAEELHKPIIKKFKKKVRSSFIDNMWGADVIDMQLISKFNKGFRFLLCVIDNFRKCAWVVPLKGKKRITIINALEKILNEPKHKPNKICVDKGSELYNRSMKSFLQNNDI